MVYKRKPVHFAAWWINERGDASAACFAKPRAIDLGRASWTLVERLVTCRRCRRALAHQDQDPLAREDGP